MTHVNRVLLKSCLLNKRWLLHGIYCIHIKFKSISEVRSLTWIQSNPQVQRTSKVYWLCPVFKRLIRFLWTKFYIVNNLLRLIIHRRSKLLTPTLNRYIFLLLVAFDSKNIKSLRSTELVISSSALLNVLCKYIFILLLNYWQMNIESTWFIFFLVFFDSSSCFLNF